MNSQNDNPYQSPSAALVENNIDGKKIFQFKRFSAWVVVGLSLVTLGIYSIYWLYSRSTTANAIHENKIRQGWLTAFVVTYVIYQLVSFTAQGRPMGAILLISFLAYITAYIAVVFGLRKSLKEMMNEGSNHDWKLNGVLTFFFSAIYFQYKINEYFDTRRVVAKP